MNGPCTELTVFMIFISIPIYISILHHITHDNQTETGTGTEITPNQQ